MGPQLLMYIKDAMIYTSHNLKFALLIHQPKFAVLDLS